MREQTMSQYHLCIQRPHLVLLGTGASRAAFPDGEKDGKIHSSNSREKEKK